ncbi:MAG: hypothetical protein HYX68_03380 [Planctomycetes bacterium]|nr:hypothetical protein [Planctomycetota bacterium]
MRRARRVICFSCWCVVGALTLAGCNLFVPLAGTKTAKIERQPIPGAPCKYSERISQFVFLSDFKIRPDDAIVKDLGRLREQVYRELRLPPADTQVFVHIFATQPEYQRFLDMRHPELPPRRAYFIAQPTRGGEDLVVYTYMNELTQRDLRHELTHAMLHCVLKRVPIWLDEGLAEYFEIPAGQNGVNAKHLEDLRQPDIRFNLQKLERLSEVQDMTPEKYREAWAWVHLMLRSTPRARQALLDYLTELRINPEPGALQPRLANAFLSIENAMQSHLAELNRKLPRGATARQ